MNKTIPFTRRVEKSIQKMEMVINEILKLLVSSGSYDIQLELLRRFGEKSAYQKGFRKKLQKKTLRIPDILAFIEDNTDVINNALKSNIENMKHEHQLID